MFNWKEIMKVNAKYFEYSGDERLISPIKDNIVNSSIKPWEVEQLPGIYFVQIIKLLQTLYQCTMTKLSTVYNEINILKQQIQILNKENAALRNENIKHTEYEETIADNACIVKAYEKCIKMQSNHYNTMKERMTKQHQVGLKKQRDYIGYSIGQLNDYFNTIIPTIGKGDYCYTGRNMRPNEDAYYDSKSNLSLRQPKYELPVFRDITRRDTDVSYRQSKMQLKEPSVHESVKLNKSSNQSILSTVSKAKPKQTLHIPMSLIKQRSITTEGDQFIKEQDEDSSEESEIKANSNQLIASQMKDKTKVIGYSGFNQQLAIPLRSSVRSSTLSLYQLRNIDKSSKTKVNDTITSTIINNNNNNNNMYSNSTMQTEIKKPIALEQTSMAQSIIQTSPPLKATTNSPSMSEAKDFMKKFLIRDNSLNGNVKEYLGQIYSRKFNINKLTIDFLISKEIASRFKNNIDADSQCDHIDNIFKEDNNTIIAFINSVFENIDMQLKPNVIYGYYYDKLCQCLHVDREIQQMQSYFAIQDYYKENNNRGVNYNANGITDKDSDSSSNSSFNTAKSYHGIRLV